MLRIALLATALLALLVPGLPGAQNADASAQLGRFSTGPGKGGPANPLARQVPNSPDAQALPTPPDGPDHKANPFSPQAQNETSLAVNPTNPLNLIGVANDYRTGNVQTGWYVSQDGGLSWTSNVFNIFPGFSFSGDPCVAFTPEGVAVIVCMMYQGPGGSAVAAFRSTNSGVSWSNAILIDLNSANDKPQIECDFSGGPHQGTLAIAWDRFGAPGGDHIYFSSSSNSGLNWTTAKRINDNTSVTGIGPDVCWGANSALYVTWADRGTFDVWVDRSFDGGANFGTDVKVADYTQLPFSIPGSVFRTFDIFAISADDTSGPFAGRVYVAYQTWTAGTQDSEIRVATSLDQGATWPTNVSAAPDDASLNDQVQPAICVDDKGNVNVAFFDRRLDPNDFLLWTWVARSSDGGASFQGTRASDVGWDHFPTEFGGTFIGDYIDIDCSPQLVHPFWCDGRSGSQDVYTDGINLDFSTNLPSISAATGGGVSFAISAGPNHGGKLYWILASGSGTAPGIPLGNGLVLPINFDAWTSLTLSAPNAAPFGSFLGLLNANGKASASFAIPGPFDPLFAGIQLDFSAVVIGALDVDYATAPTRVSLVL